jgi:Bifunctional DNA primase/polymerase, N-terminal
MRRMARGGRGLLNLAGRLPRGMVGWDVDAHSGKRGALTLAEHEARFGTLPPTWVVTARDPRSPSGIRLYRVPLDWSGPGYLRTADGKYGNVDLIDWHLRYTMAPGSLHHSGARYALIGPDGHEVTSGVLPPRDELSDQPAGWAEGLYRPRRARGERPEPGSPADLDDIAAATTEWIFDEDPSALYKTVDDVVLAISDGQTRNAAHRGLFIVAKKSRAGCYPLSRAVVQIRAAAESADAARGLGLDLDDFARSISHAVAEAIDLSEDELKRWGPRRRSDGEGRRPRWSPSVYRPPYRPPRWRP